ncbi:MAG TPA: DUF2249 domain-containing protein [Steroidobacteraceae bacterium]|nr:DUF2249 domain-containing protein [Steroidobacteraceae bacterium]
MTPFRTIDGRELPPPAPLELTLAALEDMPVGEHLLLLLYCSPQPLFNFLRRSGFQWTEEIGEDGTYAIRIVHADAR